MPPVQNGKTGSSLGLGVGNTVGVAVPIDADLDTRVAAALVMVLKLTVDLRDLATEARAEDRGGDSVTPPRAVVDIAVPCRNVDAVNRHGYTPFL